MSWRAFAALLGHDLVVLRKDQPAFIARTVMQPLLLPMAFLGTVYYPWTSLEPLPWLRWGVLVNPLVYVSEGVRMGLTRDTIPHMNGVVVYAACIALQGARIGTSSRLTVVSAAGRPSCMAGACAANPVLFGAHVPAYPLGLLTAVLLWVGIQGFRRRVLA